MIRVLIGILCLNLAIADEPRGAEETALAFLKKASKNEIKVNEDTAIAEGTTREKLKSIIDRLERLGKELGDGKREVISSKVDGQLAGVIVAQYDEFDPVQVSMHAVALIQRDDIWLAAPVPASFENTGISYVPSSDFTFTLLCLRGRARREQRGE